MQERQNNTLYEAKNLLKEGKHDDARQLLIACLKRDEDSAEAWWMLSYAIEDKEQKTDCVKRVLSLKPNYAPALARLEKLEKPTGTSQQSIEKVKEKTNIIPKQKQKKNNGVSALGFIFFCLIMAGIIYFAGGILDTVQTEGVSVGKFAPDFSLENTNGKELSLSDYEGKTVMVVFWATWCHYCEQEIPTLNTIYNKYKNQDFVILAINLGDSPEEVKKFQTSHNISYPVLLDPNNTLKKTYKTSGIPAHFVINANGKIIYAEAGSFNASELDQNMQMWLKDTTQ